MAQGDLRARVRAMEEIDESLGKYIVYYLAATQETEGTVGAQCMVGWVDRNIPTRAFPICVEPAIIGVTESEDGFALLVEFIKRYEGAIKIVNDTDFAVQRVVLEQRLVVEVQQVDVDVVGGRVLPRGRGGERLHELGLAGAAHPRDHLDVPGVLKRPKPLHGLSLSSSPQRGIRK